MRLTRVKAVSHIASTPDNAQSKTTTAIAIAFMRATCNYLEDGRAPESCL
jgi:hypothetical protein